MNDLPLYQCHKRVRACKIAAVTRTTNGWLIEPAEPFLKPIPVTVEYVTKHQPAPGGYFVLYEDGYRSYSPAQSFESGYTQIDVLADRREQLARELASVDAAIATEKRRAGQNRTNTPEGEPT